VVLVLGACTDDPATAPATPTATSGPDQSATQPPPQETPDGADAGFVASTDDPVYVDLVLDCFYGENEAGSCQRLEGAGLTADDAYGLGNSFTQAPADVLRLDCLAGAALACGELNGRVTAVLDGTAVSETELLCLFHAEVRSGTGSDLDVFHLERLLGPDAPPGVAAAAETLRLDRGDADALVSVTGYLDPICGPPAG